MALVQAVAIGLIALVLTPGFFFYFDVTPKLVLLFVFCAACAAGFRPAPRSVFSLLVLLSLLSLAVSTALSPTPALSAFGTNWRRYGAATQAAILLFAWFVSAQAHRVLPMLRMVTAAGALTAIYGIAQYFGWDPILPAASYHIGEGVWTIVRPPSTLGYVSYFATWLLSVAFLCLALPGKLPKVVAALATLAMLLTGTRAAVLGLAAGAGIWLFWLGWRASRRALAIAAALLFATIALYYSPPGQQLRSRARWFAEDPWGGARPLLWRDSLRMAGTRLAAGHGPETFTAAFPHYESAELARAYPDFAHESPHNIFLDALVAQGLPGLVLLAGFCALGFRAAWRVRDRHPTVAPALAAALGAGIVSQQFTVFTIPTAVIFFATIALAVGLDAPSPAPVGRATVRPLRLRLPAIALAAALLYLAARFALADRALALTQRSLAAGDLAAAAKYYDSAHFPFASSDVWYSRALMNAAQPLPSIPRRIQALQQAFPPASRATSTAEDPFNAWYSLSEWYAVQNDAAGAERCLRAAIAAHPKWFKPHWTLARLLDLTGRTSDAANEASLAADLDAGKHADVTSTWKDIRSRLHK